MIAYNGIVTKRVVGLIYVRDISSVKYKVKSYTIIRLRMKRNMRLIKIKKY